MARDPRLTRMLEDIGMEVRLTRDHTGRHALDPRVMEAVARVPRHRFVPEGLQDRAYDNGPLPVGHG
ncbi:MAG TPA: protein-L-isoaspartate O-methyltransferase, partial [Gammaproteobacteria bacterium]|nr:protein-L-isoaspartate O-methyltransferase [Gammaproteobacteria bacterium]